MDLRVSQKWEEIGQTKSKWPSDRNGEKMAQKWRKNRKITPNPIFCHFWATFSPFCAEGHFLFFGQFFPIFEFRPVFHSIPGGLTRKDGHQSTILLSGTLGISYHLSPNYYITAPYFWTINFGRRNVIITSQKLSWNYFWAP